MEKKILSFILCVMMFCFAALAMPNTLKAKAAMYPPRVFDQTLVPGEISGAYHPAMRDTFLSYSNTDSSVADIQYTDPFSIYIVGKNPGTTTITLYGEFMDTIINVTVTAPKQDTNGYTYAKAIQLQPH